MEEEGTLADAFAAIDAPQEAKEEPEAKEPEAEYSEPEESQQENAKQPEEEPEAESEADDEADESEGDEPEEENSAVETTIEVDGEKLTLDELKQGYLRQSDYSRKTQELAEKGIAELNEAKQQQIQLLEGTKRLIEQFNPLTAIEAQIQEARELGDETAELRLMMHYDKMRQQVANIFNATEYEKQKDEAKKEHERTEYLNAQRKALADKIPEVKTEEGRKKFQDSVYKAARELGWTDDELASLDRPDHRDAMAYHYASKYLASMKSKPQVAEKLKGKAVSPKSGARKSDNKSGLNAAFEKFNKNPNAEGSLAGIFAELG